MQVVANVATGLVAALHLYFMVLEMLLWNTPTGRRIFRTSTEFAAASRVLAANQGLYNFFLAAGLIWGIWLGESGNHIRIFFLGCVVIAGVFGGITSNRKILLYQALPGVIALTLVLWSGGAGT
jgi:putative membrane protein